MAIINQAVTKGLDTTVEMKDSGIEWLGEIPKHWEMKKIKYFVDFVNRGSTPNYVESSESKVVNQATFSKGFWNESEIKFTLVKSTEDARGLLIEDDILMASTGGGLLGKVGFFKNLTGSYIADSHVTIIRDSKKRIFPMFYFYLFSTLYSWIDGTLSKGSTNQIELQRELLRGSKFPFPCYKDQQKIVELIELKLKELDSLNEQTKNEISLIKEYQQSLISEVVTGKVDVTKQ
jgi:type I restriction enzyme S subunit